MNVIQRWFGRFRLQRRGKNHVVGWNMTPQETVAFFKGLGKTVVTFYGYSVKYNDEAGMLKIVHDVLMQYSPAMELVNIGATTGGMGVAYPLIKSLGFVTAGIVSTEALLYPESISPAVDHVCFVADKQWGGKLPNSNELSPTSQAMVACSDVLIAIGGNDIARDELLAGKALGKPIQFFAADMDHEAALRRAKYLHLPPPTSFHGSVYEVFGR